MITLGATHIRPSLQRFSASASDWRDRRLALRAERSTWEDELQELRKDKLKREAYTWLAPLAEISEHRRQDALQTTRQSRQSYDDVPWSLDPTKLWTKLQRLVDWQQDTSAAKSSPWIAIQAIEPDYGKDPQVTQDGIEMVHLLSDEKLISYRGYFTELRDYFPTEMYITQQGLDKLAALKLSDI